MEEQAECVTQELSFVVFPIGTEHSSIEERGKECSSDGTTFRGGRRNRDKHIIPRMNGDKLLLASPLGL
jgi:hypothetical protein